MFTQYALCNSTFFADGIPCIRPLLIFRGRGIHVKNSEKEQLNKWVVNTRRKSVRIQSYSGLYFLTFTLHMERYRVSLCIQSKCRKIRTRITPKTDTFRAVIFRLMKELWLVGYRTTKTAISTIHQPQIPMANCFL